VSLQMHSTGGISILQSIDSWFWPGDIASLAGWQEIVGMCQLLGGTSKYAY
jgi:hypothetical protein